MPFDEPWRRQREAWARGAGDYDARTAWLERRYLGATRPWVAGRAAGAVLEVGIGTGANVPHYPDGVTLTGVDPSDAMLAVARTKADALGRQLTLRPAEAQALPFRSGAFDAVVCTFVLCGVPDVRAALTEMLRVLVPGGRLLLADHVASSAAPVRWAQRALEVVTAPSHGEYWTRRPLLDLHALDVPVVASERRHVGVIELVDARKAQ